MTSLNRRQKHRNRTAVTGYFSDDTLDIFEKIISITGSTASSSELMELAVVSLMGRACEIFLTEKRVTGSGSCNYELLKTLVLMELEAVKEMSLETLGKSEDGNTLKPLP